MWHAHNQTHSELIKQVSEEVKGREPTCRPGVERRDEQQPQLRPPSVHPVAREATDAATFPARGAPEVWGTATRSARNEARAADRQLGARTRTGRLK